jgi:hypothetical protein
VIGTLVTGNGADTIFTPYPPKPVKLPSPLPRGLDPYFPIIKPSAIKSAPGAVPEADTVPPVAV